MRVLIFGLFVLLGAGLLAASQSPWADDRSPGADAPVMLITIEGAIGPATADYVADAIERAEAEGAQAIVLRMDTPGGLVTATRSIIRSILGSNVPVINYVSPSGAQAASAGTYIAYAAHISAMAPGTNIGAATPVQMGGSSPLPSLDEDDENDNGNDNGGRNGSRDAGEAKAIEDSVSWIRSLAEMRGRNAEWAERAVREAASITSSEAEELEVIDLRASSLAVLLREIDGQVVDMGEDVEITLATADAPVIEIEPSLLMELLAIITNPNVAFILLMLGVYGLIFEFSNPGTIVPGTIGVTCLLLGMYALNVLPLNYAGLGLLILGMGLMVAEAFAPSFGALGVGGVITFIFGASILFDTDAPGFELSWYVIAAAAAVTAALMIFVVSAAIRSARRPVVTGLDHLKSSEAEVVEWTGEKGVVMISGERWNATGNGPFQPGDKVDVRDSNGLTLIVGRRPAT